MQLIKLEDPEVSLSFSSTSVVCVEFDGSAYWMKLLDGDSYRLTAQQARSVEEALLQDAKQKQQKREALQDLCLGLQALYSMLSDKL